MINKRKLLHQVIVMIGFFLLSLILIVGKSEIGWAISVNPILPKNQHNSEATYYDLRVTPDQEQDLELELVNTSDKEKKVTLQINDATTNDSGDIDYSDRSKIVPREKSLKVSLKDIATAESELIIPAKKTVKTMIHLKMPKNQFDGMILGGIKVVSSEKNNEARDSKSKDKQHKKTYIVAVKLTETDAPVAAKLNLLDVGFSKESKKNIIKAVIQNEQAVNLEDIEFVGKAYKENSDELYSQTKVTGYRMAPNSSFTFILDGEQQGFLAGKYHIALTAKSKATNQEWKWDKELEIIEAEDKKVGTSTIKSTKEHIMFYTIICMITFVFLLILLLFLLISRKRKEKRYEEALHYRKQKRDRDSKNTQRNRKRKRNKIEGAKKKRPTDQNHLEK